MNWRSVNVSYNYKSIILKSIIFSWGKFYSIFAVASGVAITIFLRSLRSLRSLRRSRGGHGWRLKTPHGRSAATRGQLVRKISTRSQQPFDYNNSARPEVPRRPPMDTCMDTLLIVLESRNWEKGKWCQAGGFLLVFPH